MLLGSLTLSEIDDLLTRESVARLGCTANGEPYVVPIAYAREPGIDGVIWHTMPGQKLDAMRAHPGVCLEVDQVEGPTSWRSVVARGVVEELTGAERRDALDRLVARLLPPGAVPSGVDPFCPPGAEDAAVMVRVRFTEKTGRFARP